MFEAQDNVKGFEGSSDVLKDKTVMVVGLGGLGTHSVEMLVRMGVGKVILFDDDVVEWSNLGRQGIYRERDIGVFKVDVVHEFSKEVRKDVRVRKERWKFLGQDIGENVDVIIDGTDNEGSRYRIDEYSRLNKVPWVYASALGSKGSVIPFIPGETPCLECIWGEEKGMEDKSCSLDGVLPMALTWAVSLQVMEAVNILMGHNVSMEEIQYDVWTREEIRVDLNGFGECTCEVTQGLKEYKTCGTGMMVYIEDKHREMVKEFLERQCKNVKKTDLFWVFGNKDSEATWFKNGMLNVYEDRLAEKAREQLIGVG